MHAVTEYHSQEAIGQMPHDGTAEAPSKFRAIVFITDKLGKFLPLFFGGFTHAWGVNSLIKANRRDFSWVKLLCLLGKVR